VKENRPASFTLQALGGFVAGFLATLVFHQLVLAILRAVGLAPFGPFNINSTHPFGIPAFLSLSLWGGLWGVFFAFGARAFPRGVFYWAMAFLFGAILPSAVALLVVLPLKGLPVGGGWRTHLLLTVFIVNGAWGVGTALFLRLFSPRHKNQEA
jgi:hypothetical protein